VHPLVASTSLGRRAPAYCVAPGKVLLAFGPPAERERVLNGPLVAFTARTLCDPASLAAELDAVVERGYAVNSGEHFDGIGGVAVPVRAPDGEVVAAMGFTGPPERVLARLSELVAALRAACNTSDAPLGHVAVR
jgi:IclR family transcriptional regulator, KDG regulon repressor